MIENKIKEITQDLVNTIVRGETMVPICSVGPLLERIEELEQHIRKTEDDKDYQIPNKTTESKS